MYCGVSLWDAWYYDLVKITVVTNYILKKSRLLWNGFVNNNRNIFSSNEKDLKLKIFMAYLY